MAKTLIISSQDSENLEKSLCAKNMAKDSQQIPVIFALKTALKTGMTLFRESQHGLINTSTCCL